MVKYFGVKKGVWEKPVRISITELVDLNRYIHVIFVDCRVDLVSVKAAMFLPHFKFHLFIWYCHYAIAKCVIPLG